MINQSMERIIGSFIRSETSSWKFVETSPSVPKKTWPTWRLSFKQCRSGSARLDVNSIWIFLRMSIPAAEYTTSAWLRGLTKEIFWIKLEVRCTLKTDCPQRLNGHIFVPVYLSCDRLLSANVLLNDIDCCASSVSIQTLFTLKITNSMFIS